MKVERIMKQISKEVSYSSSYKIGDNILVTKGAFANATGKIIEIN